MAFNVNSNFAGKAAGFYVSAALKQAKSLDFLSLMENIKYESNIQKMAGADVVRDATCDFTDHGTLDLTEKVLKPKLLQINIDLCKKRLLTSWEALEMKAGAGAMPPVSFEDYVISYMGEIIANATETSIWTGADANNGEFEGFLTAGTGVFAVDGTVHASTATAPYSTTNIIANLQTLTADMAANVPNILTNDDTYIYMNAKTYSLYISAVSTLGYVNAYNMNGDYEPVFEGYKVAVCPGLSNDEMVGARRSNLFFGTDLVSDHTRIQLMDMGLLDGSDNIRVVGRYSGGVQLGEGTDIVHQS